MSTIRWADYQCPKCEKKHKYCMDHVEKGNGIFCQKCKELVDLVSGTETKVVTEPQPPAKLKNRKYHCQKCKIEIIETVEESDLIPSSFKGHKFYIRRSSPKCNEERFYHYVDIPVISGDIEAVKDADSLADFIEDQLLGKPFSDTDTDTDTDVKKMEFISEHLKISFSRRVNEIQELISELRKNELNGNVSLSHFIASILDKEAMRFSLALNDMYLKICASETRLDDMEAFASEHLDAHKEMSKC